jgi:predicted nucleotidyltransferase
MFFCVTGYLHPPELYTAFLKYSPDPVGKWKKGETAYRRDVPYYHVRSVAETIRYLERHYPGYVQDCPVRNIRFSMVPKEYVARYYNPQGRLREIMANPGDPLEEDAAGLAEQISGCAGIPVDELGVTGSILIELHNPVLSDINLLVYGLDNAWKLRRKLREGGCSPIQWLDGDLIDRWTKEMTAWFPLTADESRYSVSRRWNYGFYRGRFFGIHPTRTDAEITERYGQRIYRSRGPAQIRAVVVDTREALFQPAVYRITDVQVLTGNSEAFEVREVISYEGRFRDVVDTGQMIEAQGKLESVNGDPRRLVIGTTQLAGKEYIKPVKRDDSAV